MKRIVGSAILLLALAVGLAGCESIPRTGGVESGLADLGNVEQQVQFNPLGPVAGSSQEDIVRGFLLAATSPEDGYAVAREFLAPEYANHWDPELGVLVDEGARPYTSEDPAAATMQVHAVASIDESGTLLPSLPGTGSELRFEFAEINGEWRITSAPAGIVLDRDTFMAIWSPHQLFFLGAENTLVPETRWYQSRSSLPTAITNGLLHGSGLGDAVRSAFPAETALVNGVVPVVDGQARIDLSSDVLEVGPERLSEMSRQLRESLRTAPGVTGIEIYADGTPVPLAGSEGDSAATSPESTNPVILAGGEFGFFSGGEISPIEGISEDILALNPSAVTLADNEKSAVVRSDIGVSLVTDEGSLLVDPRSSLVEPALDRFGYVWTYRSGAKRITVSNATGQTVTLDAPWLEDLTPVAVRVSPDGSRIAALAPSGGSDSVVLVATVERNESGDPVSISEDAEPQMYASGAPVDFDWIGAVRFASLTRSGGTGNVTVGGPGLLPSTQGGVPDAVRIAVGGSRAQLRLLTGSNELYASQGSGWQKTLDGVSVLAKRN